jgi:hypothetical protein
MYTAMRTLLFPDIKTFGEVFPEAVPYVPTHGSGEPPCPPKWGAIAHATGTITFNVTPHPNRREASQMVFSPSLAIRKGGHRYKWAWVKVPDHIIQKVMEFTIVIDHDTMNWEIVIRDDDSALIICNHSQIIGSTWVALIPASTLPAVLLPEPLTGQ